MLIHFYGVENSTANAVVAHVLNGTFSVINIGRFSKRLIIENPLYIQKNSEKIKTENPHYLRLKK